MQDLFFPDDFAINDFAFIGSDGGKQRDGKIIDGKIMMSFEIADQISTAERDQARLLRISDFGLRICFNDPPGRNLKPSGRTIFPIA